jgi:hypothetical protein
VREQVALDALGDAGDLALRELPEDRAGRAVRVVCPVDARQERAKPSRYFSFEAVSEGAEAPAVKAAAEGDELAAAGV